MSIKKAWITKHSKGSVELILQSYPKGIKLQVEERYGKDLHKIKIGFLTSDDLELLQDTINEYLYDKNTGE